MAGIQDYLRKILSAVYGRDVRQSIHDAIKQCYEDGKAGSVDLVVRERLHATPLAEFCDAEIYGQVIADDYFDMSNAGIQGFAIGEIDGRTILCVGITVGTAESDKGKLILYDLSDGSMIRYKDNLDIGHVNGMTFCDKDQKFYVACAGGNNGIHKVVSYDINLQSLVREDKYLDAPYGIAYNKDTETFYVALANSVIAEYDYNFKRLRTGNLAQANDMERVAQSIWTDGEYLYFISNNLSDGENYNKFDVYHLSDLSFYRKQYVLVYGELESCCWYNGNLYLMTNCNHTGVLYRGSHRADQNTYAFIPANVYGGNRQPVNGDTRRYWFNSSYKGLFVENTQDRPFGNYYAMVNYTYKNKKATIQYNITGSVPNNINIKRREQGFEIVGHDREDGSKATVKGIYVRNVPNCLIRNIEVTSRSDAENALIALMYVGYAYLDNVTFNGSGEENDALKCIATDWRMLNSTFRSTAVRDLIYSTEGSSGYLDDDCVFDAPGTIENTGYVRYPYRADPYLFSKRAIGNTVILGIIKNFDPTTIQKPGFYRLEKGSTSINVPSELIDQNYMIEVKNLQNTNDTNENVREYVVTTYSGKRWRGILDVTDHTLTWLADYSVIVPGKMIDGVAAGEVYLHTTDFKTATISGTFEFLETTEAGDAVISFDDSRLPGQDMEYALMGHTLGSGALVPFYFKGNKIHLPRATTEKPTVRIAGTVILPDIKFTIGGSKNTERLPY